MTHSVEAQIDLESRLLQQASDIALLLHTPPSEGRTNEIANIWQKIASSYGPYQRGQADIRAHTAVKESPPPTLKQIEARAEFLHYGAHRASLWEKIGTLLERQSETVQSPLVDTQHVRAVTRQDDLLSYLTNALHNLANPIAYNNDHARENQFLDIALSGGHFINLIHAAYRVSLAQGRSGPLRFIDVGCGGGSKVIMASHFFEHAVGLEYNTDFVHHARRTIEITKAVGCSILEGDALTFPDYAAYDIIYFYRPISNNGILTQMETRIVDMVKPGTIIIAPMGFQKPGAFTGRITSITANIYVTQTSRKDAAQIRRRAEMIGPDWQVTNHEAEKAAGFWRPIIQASRANGYCLPR